MDVRRLIGYPPAPVRRGRGHDKIKLRIVRFGGEMNENLFINPTPHRSAGVAFNNSRS